MILLIDNFDSFVYNLARYVENLGYKTLVKRNNQVSIEEILRLKPSHIILSPGPCTPKEAGISLEIIKSLGSKFPILGVCLGHQVIGEALGGNICAAKTPAHGKASKVSHNKTQLFSEIPNPFHVGRYHSLVVEHRTLPEELEVTAFGLDGDIMALSHKKLPMFGVQFHPESILTPYGAQILKNFFSYTI